MIEDPYQMVDELSCKDLFFLKNKGHMKNNKMLRKIKNKCENYSERQ